MSACTSTALNKATQAVSPYFQEKRDTSIRLAILEPSGNGLSARERQLLSRTRAVLLYDFSSFSHVVLADQEQLDRSASSYTTKKAGVFSDEDAASIGMMSSARYILYGSISKEEGAEDRLRFQVAIVDIESSARIASQSASVSFEELLSAQAVQQAFIDCAGQLGIVLTEAGAIEVNKLDTPGIQGALAYAQALEARKSGQLLEELHYLFAAVNQAPLLLDAQKRLAVLSALLAEGKALESGEGAHDLEAWRKLLVSFERFYSNNPFLFDMVHSKTPFIDDETGSVEFWVSLCRNASVDAMQDVINALRHALSAAPDLEQFSQWPLVPALPRDKVLPLFSINDYYVDFGLYNAQNELVSQTEVFLYTQTVFFEEEIITDSMQLCRGVFPDSGAEDVDEGSYLKILNINERDAQELQIQGKWNIVPTQELPRPNPKAAYFTQGRDAGKAQPEKEPEKPLQSLDWFRLGIGVTGYFLNDSENVLNDDPNSLLGIVELGIKWITVEAFIHSSYGSFAQSFNSVDSLAYGLGANFTFIWHSFLFSLGGGYSHYLDRADTVFVQTKIDLVPESFGLGLRIGYKADLFSLAEETSFQFNGKVMAGLLFWL